MNAVKSYQDLIGWQKSIELVSRIYKLTKTFPKEEIYGITTQMQRAAVSVPANIAEGQARNGAKEFCQFLGIAKGSLAELETYIILAVRLDYIETHTGEGLLADCQEIGKILNGLLRALSRSR